MIAGKDDAGAAADGNPAGSFQGLGGLVDKQRAKLLTVKQSVGRPYQRASDDTRLAEELGIDTYLKLGGALLEALHLLVVLVVAPLAVSTQVAYGLADSPQQFVVGVALKASLIGEGEHLVVDARRVADTKHGYAAVDELLADPVYSHVALSAYQHLRFAA